MRQNNLISICLILMLLFFACSKNEQNKEIQTIDMNKLSTLSNDIKAKFAVLRPQSIRSSEGYIKYDYLIPAGFYKQMWDWDSFFIGCHLSSKNLPKYLRFWVLNFAELADDDGYIPGCITTKGPRPLFGKFAIKPFLAQGAYIASKKFKDFSWIKPVYENIKKVCLYREQTQFDPKYGLYFWDNAMQSGADNNVVLTNDDRQRSAILGVDINVFQYREFLAMKKIARKLKREKDAIDFEKKAISLKENILKYHWYKEDFLFWNIRRRDGRPIKRVSYSNFIPLIQKDLISQRDGEEMIKRYLWNENHMLAPYGIRTLSKQDPDYNNENIIAPYSNWQGPVWPLANYLYFIGLKNYGFENECKKLALIIGIMVSKDIQECGSMHQNYHADTGAPLAPTTEQSKNRVFTGFVGWNLLIENMFMGIVDNNWLLLTIDP